MSAFEVPLDAILAHVPRGIVVDTGPLLLFYATLVSEDLPKRFKRTQDFAKADQEVLLSLLAHFPKRFTTPQVMTEVSNLSDGIFGQFLSSFFEVITVDLGEVKEIYTSTQELSASGRAVTLGFADLSLMYVARKGPLLLSTDARLCEWCNREGMSAINFNWLRTF